MADATTVFIAKIIAIRSSNPGTDGKNNDVSTAISKFIPTWRSTNTDLNTAIRDAP